MVCLEDLKQKMDILNKGNESSTNHLTDSGAGGQNEYDEKEHEEEEEDWAATFADFLEGQRLGLKLIGIAFGLK